MSPSTSLLVALALGVACGFAAADEGCRESASSDLERLYCDILAEGGGRGLPSQADFRRNEPRVQALLLRRPAARLGLAVPAVASPPAQAQPEPESLSASSPKSVAADQNVAPPQKRAGRLAECRLDGERIVCPDQRFDLVLNQPNSKLAPGVLEQDNRLGLASFTGDRTDEQAVRRYLSGAYDRYIPKMVAIGLGANTMSFTAFHNAFQTLEAGGVDFATRMERTYQLLKQDKLTLAVQARYHEALPESLSLCEVINRNIIVCDNVATNWVFRSPAR